MGSVFDPLQLASSLACQTISAVQCRTLPKERKDPKRHYTTVRRWPTSRLSTWWAGHTAQDVTCNRSRERTPEPCAGITCCPRCPTRLGRGQRRSEHSSCSGSPMSLGFPAMASSLALALKVHTHPPMPLMLGGREESSEDSDKEEEEEMATAEADAEWKED